MSSMRNLLLLTLASASIPLFAADDWPEFRGPTGQGTSSATHLPVQWSATNNVAWKQPIPGKGWSSPVLHAGKLYVTSAVSEGTADLGLTVFSLDAKSGAILWHTAVFQEAGAQSPRIHQKNSHASPTPIVDGDRLYVHFGHQGTACLDLKGAVIWRNTEFKYPPVHGNGGSPILADNALVFSCDGARDPFIVALNKKTGKLLWKVNRQTDAAKTFSFSTPLFITVNGQKQIISPGSNVVCAYDPKDGHEIWRVRYDGYSVVPRPVYGHGLIFISTSFDRPSVLAIRPDGKGDVTDTHVAWKISKGAPNTPSLLLVSDELYMVADSGVATCMDARTGAVHWQERVCSNCSASPLYADGKIYIQDEQGQGVVLKPGKTFTKLASNVLNERTLASYAVTDGAFFIRTAENLYRIQGQ